MDEKRPAEPPLPDSVAFTRDPALATRLAVYRRRLARRSEAPQAGAWVSDHLGALDGAVATLRKTSFQPGATEAAWMALHQVRQVLCLREDRAALIEIAHEIQEDLADCAVAHPALRAQGQALINELVAGDGPPPALLRNKLYSLAIIAGGKRESDWRNANHVVGRRQRAAIAVVVVTFMLLVALPFGFEHVSVGEGMGPLVYSWLREAGCILAVLACGALGGLMSVLLRHEQILLNSVEHHVFVATTRLRPVVGAASALVFFIIWESGLLQIADSGHRRPGVVSGTMLLIAVVAGFSERLLVGQIQKISAVIDGTVTAHGSAPAEIKDAESGQKEPAGEGESADGSAVATATVTVAGSVTGAP